MDDFNYITEEFGTLNEKSDRKFSLELNLISYREKKINLIWEDKY